jgi:hypothetical protein
MRRDELRALGDLAAEAAAGIAGQAGDVHAGIAQRVFGALGSPAAPARVLHDRIAAGAYGGTSFLCGALVRGGAGAASLALGGDARSISDGPRGRLAVAALNGVVGDRLCRRRSALQAPMAVRSRGRDVPVDAASLRQAFPQATGRLAVFIHGLCESEDAWRLGADRSAPYGDRLGAELGYTPIYVGYNSGLHISTNGRRLAAILDDLIAGWPTEVLEVSLIGHSMGGLVARAACHYAGPGSWRDRVRNVLTLGSPHRGAPAERVANAVCHAASLLPETRPFGTPIRLRSAGIKDLGYGYVVDDDWAGHDPDAFRANTGTAVPFLATVDYYFVSATLSRSADARAGRLVGDLLVLRPSAWSHDGEWRECLRFPADRYVNLGGANHFDLLNHPVVYAQIHRWLDRPGVQRP